MELDSPGKSAGLVDDEEARLSFCGDSRAGTAVACGHLELARYWTDRYGVIHQADPVVTVDYDVEYVRARYDSLPDHGRQMSMLRAGFVAAAVSGTIGTLMDVGYGNGDFLALMASWGVDCHGLDISGYPVPETCTRANVGQITYPWDAITFFDSLEHMPDISFLYDLRANYLVFTFPWCHTGPDTPWFKEWKHRRPGEHLHHFSPASLRSFISACGYREIACSSVEDIIRRPLANGLPNTFTSAFRKC